MIDRSSGIVIDDEDEGDFGAAPTQACGTLPDGRRFYFRARHRNFRLEIAPFGYDPIDDHDESNTVVRFDLDGWVDDRHPLSTDLTDHVRPLIEFLAYLAADLEARRDRNPFPGLRRG